MGKLSSLFYGLGIGAGLMYFLDPQSGERRKAMVRDKITSTRRSADEAVETGLRNLRSQASGLVAEGIALMSNEAIPSYVIEERVRSRLGFLTHHPDAIQVSASGRDVTLSGDILASEVERLMKGMANIRGINEIHNNLRVHQEPGDIPQLQRKGWVVGEERGSMMWSPSTRLLVGVGALYLMLYGMRRGGFIGLLARLGGIVLGARALTNFDLRIMTGQPSDFEAVRVRKAIDIQAPVDEVYSLWSNFENFPRFMKNVEEIRDLGQGQSHWVVKGPAGAKVEFDAKLTENIPNKVVAWKTLPDSEISHHGKVHFKESQKGTQVSVNMAYMPPAGASGHMVARLFGKDPKSEMDADLMRMKSLLEESRTTADSQKETRQQVMPVTGKNQEDENRETMKNMDGGPNG